MEKIQRRGNAMKNFKIINNVKIRRPYHREKIKTIPAFGINYYSGKGYGKGVLGKMNKNKKV